MKYREATSADWEAIAALHALSWQKAYRGALRDEFLDGPVVESRRERWQQRFSEPPPNQYVVLAENDDGSLAGFGAAYGEEHEDWGTLLDNLHVHPDLHEQGIGKQLVRRVARWCRDEHPALGMYLSVLEQNERAQRFYEGLGGQDVGGDTWIPPDGGSAKVRHYVWDIERVKALAEGIQG